jgi:nucleotide-binding universal stress UspA family protein
MSSTGKRFGIIVGVDGSPASDAAVAWAARNAASRGSALTLMHADSPATPTWAQAPELENLAGWQEAQGRSLLDSAAKIARDAVDTSSPLHINGELFLSPTIPTLVDRSAEADLIVVGTDGRGALKRGLLGSVSSGLIRHAHCPVAIIHDEHLAIPNLAEAPVLVGIDGKTSDIATEIAFEEASRRGVGVIALHAWSDVDMDSIPGFDWSPVTEKEDRLLTEALAGWQERHPDVTVDKRLVSDHAAHALIKTSEAAQLVVVGSHGSGAFSGMLLGSVSNAVVQSIRRPVIVARVGAAG